MTTFYIKISDTKKELITYCGYLIDNCFVFTFNDGDLIYIPKERLELYKFNGKLTN
jgi:hypothetical protein